MGVSITTSGSGQVDVQDGAAPSVQLSQSPVGGANLVMSSGASVSFVNNNPSAVAVSGTQAVAVAVNAPTAQSAVINSSLSIGYVDGKWGDLTGTITNQTDLVNYITSRLSSDTINDAADVLQVLDNAGLTLGEDVIDAKVPFTIFGTDENGDPIVIPQTTTPLGYTLPKPHTELLSGVPYFMVTKSDGTNINLSWLNLGFALGDDDEYILDGGQYGS